MFQTTNQPCFISPTVPIWPAPQRPIAHFVIRGRRRVLRATGGVPLRPRCAGDLHAATTVLEPGGLETTVVMGYPHG